MITSYSILILAAGIISSNCHPIDPKVLPVADGFGIVVLGTAFLLTTVVALIFCTCCKQRRDGFKEFQNPEIRDVGFSNALSSELAIFPPPGGGPPNSSPLPVPASPLNPPSKPAAFSSVIPSISDWFSDPNANFPRQQLFYQKEIGKGWFGKVVKGEGRGVKVVVRILREDATPEEKAYFLHEARPFKDLRHKNITRLFGRCLENDPFLLLFHFSANGDLKSFLVTNSGSRNAITEQKISLKMMLDVTEGLKCMNENGFIHTDLAARNCLVSSDLTVKIGDYGTSIDKYKGEYYIAGEVAVPLRWCAPETLTISPTTIETNQVTEEGNVWSLGVLLWEIAEFGKLPYTDLSDEQVIIQVLGEGNLRLPQPNCSFGQYLHNIMTSCWKREGRATIDQVLSMLVYLKTNPFQESDFEARWKMLKPNTVAVVDNHTPIHSPRHTLLAQRPQLPAKLEFDSGVDLEIKPADENPDSCRTSTPITVSPQLSVASEEIFHTTQHKSPSLTNLKGSLEDITQFDSWLTGVEQKTEEDRKFAKNISEAIKNLDETLALEKTSSSSADSSLEGAKKPLLDFRLGPLDGEKKGDSLSSDTEEETWRKRIERGEFSEKVKEKSKSVTDLMVLTHIESEGSESDSLPSLTRQCSMKKGPGGVSFTGVGFGSEGNIRNAVLSDELQDKLRQLALWKTDTDQSFLGKGASETIHLSNPTRCKRSSDRSLKPSNLYSETLVKPDPVDVNSNLGSVNNLSVMKKGNNLETVNTQPEFVQSEVNVLVTESSSAVGKEGIQNVIGGLTDIEPLESSHSVDNSVPKIVITESELPDDTTEAESDLDTGYFVDIKPRKFVFVCRDLDDECDITNDQLPYTRDSTPLVRSSGDSSTGNNDSSVILGPCNEHTLDYFKGLKTTFMPAEEMYGSPYCNDVNDIDVICDAESVEDNDDSNDKIIGKINDEDGLNYPLPDLVPEISVNNFKSSTLADELGNCNINGLIKKPVELPIENKHLIDRNVSNLTHDDLNNLINCSVKDICDDFTQITENEDSPFCNDEKFPFDKGNFVNDRTLNSNDSLSTDSPIAGTNILISSSSDSSDSGSNSSSVNSSDEQLVEAPFPFNQPIITEQLKSKSLDSFLISKNDFEHINKLMNGVTRANNINTIKNRVPVFNMTESVSENTFINQNVGYDPYFSADSGHSSDRCMEQDKQMNDLKSRLEDVVKSGSDFQLKNSEEEYGGKLLTPDDERSSDSGFRDKGSLSESVEDTCDEKYNLEDIDAELDDFTAKSINSEDLRYYEQLVNDRERDSSGWFLSTRQDSDVKENGWVSQSTENEESLSLSMDAEFAAAIRNELKEKLPGAQQNEKSDEDNSPEGEEQELNTEFSTQFSYPSQLSPIMEEQESNHSSLQLNDSSPTFLLPPPPDSNSGLLPDDTLSAFYSLKSPSSTILDDSVEGDTMLIADEKNIFDDDVLMVDTETNEATIIESPKPQSHLTFIIPEKNEWLIKNTISPDMHSENFIISPDNAPSTPNSAGTESHSSPENGNMSGFFLSPCSVLSDLFDSGPPSLPFDLGQSLEEVEDLPIHKVASNDNISVNELHTEKAVISPPSPSNGIDDKITSDVNEDDAHTAPVLNADDNLLQSDPSTSDQKRPEERSNDLKNNLPLPMISIESKVSPNETPSEFLIEPNLKPINEGGLNLSENNQSTKSPVSSEDSWLKNLIFADKPAEEVKESVSTTASKALSDDDWPKLEELLPTKKGGVGITSTLALLSPEVGGEEKSWDGGEGGRCWGNGGEVGPLPSPEDGWRPTISQLMELTEAAAEGEEMTTSFIDPDPNGTYTPDWESDISESSSSGEFLWKEGDKEDLIKCVATDTNSLLEEASSVMERIEEEDEDCHSTSTDSDDSSEGSVSTDFRPSTWDSKAKPLRPILRTPSTKVTSEGKRVVFKKERYHCVYEYPREDSDSDEEVSWQTPATSLFDYSVFADWELGEGEVAAVVESVDSDSEEGKSPNNPKEFDFYRLDYNPTSQVELQESLPVSESEFVPLASDLTPVRLGDLKHTKATLRLEIPPLRPDHGEASILDSTSQPA